MTDQRFKQETLLDEELIKVKDDQIAQMKAEREQVQVKLQANVELQKLKEEAKDLVEKIDDGLVNHELLQIQVAELETATQNLNEKKEDLIEEKKRAELKNEELVRELKAKEEINEKKMQAKLARDKNATWKELIAKQETSQQYNNELL